MTTKLSVNLNKVALIRNSRKTTIPSVVEAAEVAIAAGADGITVHPRPDMRHIRTQDVLDLAELLAAPCYAHVEFNIEGNPYAGPEGEYPGFMALVEATRPSQATLVPDDPSQLTSDHGWDLKGQMNELQGLIAELQSWHVRVSLFMDSDVAQIAQAARLGVERIELYTGPFADSWGSNAEEEVFKEFYQAAEAAQREGLTLNAGHDLNLDNLAQFATVPGLAEVSIGHAIVSDALFRGLATVVADYKAILMRT